MILSGKCSVRRQALHDMRLNNNDDAKFTSFIFVYAYPFLSFKFWFRIMCDFKIKEKIWSGLHLIGGKTL